MKKLFLVIFIAGAFSSCKKEPEKDNAPVTTPSAFNPGEGVFITNEGNYTFGNAKLSYYDFSAASVTADVFQSLNSRPLGDVCQSMKVINGKGYIVMNNSGKIEVVNMPDQRSVTTITGFTSPRYIVQVSSSKAYVSDLYANAISIVDLVSNQRTGTINCPGWTEQLIKSGNNVYITSHDRGKLYVINTINDQLTDSINLVKGANSLTLDNSGKLWVLCSGEASSSINGALYRINTGTNAIESTLPFPAAESPWRLTRNGAGDTLYYLNSGVYKMWTGASSLPTAAHISQGTKNFYGLGVDPLSGRIYVSDAIDFVQSGKVYVYTPSGNPVTDFLAGIIPGDFCFY